MEIKDINVSVERLDEVRGGSGPSIHQFGVQLGGNVAAGATSNYGVGNVGKTDVYQDSSQQMTQVAALESTEKYLVNTEIANSIFDFGWGPLKKM